MDKLHADEASRFSDIEQGPPATLKLFLYIRNRLVLKNYILINCFAISKLFNNLFILKLQLWLENSKTELTLDHAMSEIEPPYNR